MLEHWFVLGCPASIKIIAWSLYNIPSCGRGNLTPTHPTSHQTSTLPRNTPNPITATENVVGSIIFLPVQIDFIPFSPTFPNLFSLPLTCTVHLIYRELPLCKSLYWSKLFSLHIEGILLYHLPAPTIKVFLNEIITETVYFYLLKDDKQDLQTLWEMFSSMQRQGNKCLLSNQFFWCPTGSLENTLKEIVVLG